MIVGDSYGFYQLILRKHACRSLTFSYLLGGPLLQSQSFNYLSFRLRYILHQLNSGQLPLDDLKKNIEYAALVLETAYMDETRLVKCFDFTCKTDIYFSRICDEDDDLAEVTPDTVPDEVREWLAATFTRQAANAKKREKPKFKSVANAIRTGIFFDK